MRGIVVAMECEAAAVRPHLREGDVIYLSGIGKVNAAAATQKAISDGADEIINVGVAGGFESEVEIFGVYEISRAVEYDFDLSEVNGTSPGVHDERDTPYFSLNTRGIFQSKTLGTGDKFGNGEENLPLLKSPGVGVRDMEGAAIAHVCEKAQIPFRAVKCITNIVGRGSTDSYAQNLKKALLCLSDALTSWM